MSNTININGELLRLQDDGLDLDVFSLRITISNGVLHHGSKDVNCAQLNFEKSKGSSSKVQVVSWKEILDNDYQICDECGPKLADRGGWYDFIPTIYSLDEILHLGQAAQTINTQVKNNSVNLEEVKELFRGVKKFCSRNAYIRQPQKASKWARPKLKALKKALSLQFTNTELLSMLDFVEKTDSERFAYVSSARVRINDIIKNSQEVIDGVKDANTFRELLIAVRSSYYHEKSQFREDSLLVAKLFYNYSGTNVFEVPFSSVPLFAAFTQDVMLFEKQLSPAALEIVSSLYNPYEKGEYSDFENCFAAAKAF